MIISELTNKELKNILRENNIKNYSKLTKKDLVKKVNQLIKAQNGGGKKSGKNKKYTMRDLIGGAENNANGLKPGAKKNANGSQTAAETSSNGKQSATETISNLTTSSTAKGSNNHSAGVNYSISNNSRTPNYSLLNSNSKNPNPIVATAPLALSEAKQQQELNNKEKADIELAKELSLQTQPQTQPQNQPQNEKNCGSCSIL
jgi:hypothetical protein